MTNPTKTIIPRFTAFLVAFLLFLMPAIAGEGMWIPLLLKALNESEMKSMGMKMKAEDIYSVNKGSLKDAIVHFGGFCTGEVISDQGLLLTNHHCGYSAIQDHSTLEQNYLRDGFWAKSNQEEIPTPGLFATFIVRIEDVTKDVFAGTKDDMTVDERKSIIDKNLITVRDQASKESWQSAFVRSFFEGNQYFIFITETYNDIRYVGSPPESIGKFGADTDNWVWPRHTGDFSLFRIYAGPDNRPAEYASENRPYKPKHYFPISLDGIDEGDFTLVFGFPGRTSQYLPSYAIAQTIDIIDPARIGVRNISLGIMDAHMRESEDARLAYASKYASISNSWKKWIGEVLGLKSTKAVEKKELQEAEFTALLQKNKKLNTSFGHLLPEMKENYNAMDTLAKNRYVLGEVIGGSNVELFLLTSYADRLVKAYAENGEDGYEKMSARVLTALDNFFKDYRVEIDKELFAALTAHLASSLSPDLIPEKISTVAATNSFASWSEQVYTHTALTQLSVYTSAINTGGASFSKLMEMDEAYQTYLAVKKIMDEQISPDFNDINAKLQVLQQDYVTALMQAYPDRRFWPDANGTLRVSYGQVEPYAPRDGMTYKTQTYLDGIIEKYVPGDYEFDVHPRLLELYAQKDYGQYGENGKLPVCFIASNHTTGGNSGSPAIDAYGNLIGLNFDRVWEGTMSDLNYDQSICRNIMVDARFILFVIDNFAGASHLIDEMKLVHPKS